MQEKPTGQKGFFMDRENARQEIRRQWREILPTITGEARQKMNGEKSYICPICGHGSHGDGMTRNPKSADGNGLKCFGCGFSGDIIDLYQKTAGADYNTALSLLANQIGITIDGYNPTAARRPEKRERPVNGAATERKTADKPAQAPTAPKDYSDYYAECMGRLHYPEATAYLESRGISPATAAAYWIGFDPAADPARAGHPAPRIIIPTTLEHYIGRSIDPKMSKGLKKLNVKDAPAGIFNLGAVYAQGVQEVFVTEGAFDALSFIEVGSPAIALNSTSNVEKMLQQLEKRRTGATLIICLDNDEAGKKGTEALTAGLQRLNISHVVADVKGNYKDPNEYLVANRKAFIEAVEQAKHKAAGKPDNTLYYIEQVMGGEIARFREVKKTGFDNLDEKAGGLYGGLYVIAAISSLGKTTFAAQIADQLAAAGTDVLFFSLEQSRLELVSKSIARRTAQNDLETAVSSLAIRRGYLPKQVTEAAREYTEAVKDRVSIIEGNFACNISFIGDYIRQYIRRNNTRPVVFLDYLQILQPEQNGSRQQSTREMVDSTITELKRISREMDLTVFVISSVNRSNYLTPIDFESLKESGGIEYTADVIWGLQLQCLNDSIFDKQNNIKERRARIKEAKAATPRKIELVCLKNRYGVANFSCYFDYYPANDLFTVCSESELDFAEDPKPKKAGRKL